MVGTNTALGSRTSTPSCTRLVRVSSQICRVKLAPLQQHAHGILCTFSQMLKYLSNTPCSRQSPEIVKEFLSTMMPHKLTKSVRSHNSTNVVQRCFLIFLRQTSFPSMCCFALYSIKLCLSSSEQKNCNC